MSTRATYGFSQKLFITQNPPATACIYIHHDGYEAGAASYFYRMLRYVESNEVAPNSSQATIFVKANERAELTGSHDAHGDTQYRYDLVGRGPEAKLTVLKQNFNDWDSVYNGPLSGFLRIHQDAIFDAADGEVEAYLDALPSSRPADPTRTKLVDGKFQQVAVDPDDVVRSEAGR